MIAGRPASKKSDASLAGLGQDREMRPLPGMVPIAEYPNRWEANVAAARLLEAGYESTVLIDPATDVAPHHVTHRIALVVVREAVADRAAEILGSDQRDHEAERLDAGFHQRRFADRPDWVRYTTWLLILAVIGPLLVTALWLWWTATSSLFP